MQSHDVLDKTLLWHPFTQHDLESEFPEVISATGAWMTFSNGHRILDAISSWWVNIHGHCHPQLIEAMTRQAQRLDHVIFAGFSHAPAVNLARILLESAKKNGADVNRCFYSDNGSTAIEVALKIAYQYHQNKGCRERKRFIALTHAYHGDTLGAMSVSARDSYHKIFSDLLLPVDFININQPETLEQLFKSHSPSQYAALIVEPMVQGAAGMLMHSPENLKAVSSFAQENNILVIADEIFTGFYRTGKMFAFEHAHIKPEIITVAKGLTGGMLPLAATLVSENIFLEFKQPNLEAAFLHGHSYTANPIACAVAIASWKLLHEVSTQEAIIRISSRNLHWINHFKQYPYVKEARALGTISAIELNDKMDLASFRYEFRRMAIEKGVLLRPLGNVIYAVPPYCTTDKELDLIYNAIDQILDVLCQESIVTL